MDECTCGKPEEWRPIPGIDGYEISDHGRVISLKFNRRALRKLQIAKRGGYPQFGIVWEHKARTIKCHVAVMLAFVGARPGDKEIRHLDNDALNAHLSNLAYGTHTENVHDTLDAGRQNNQRKTHCPQGHPYDEENTYLSPARGIRFCRACQREAGRVYYAAHRAEIQSKRRMSTIKEKK